MEGTGKEAAGSGGAPEIGEGRARPPPHLATISQEKGQPDPTRKTQSGSPPGDVQRPPGEGGGGTAVPSGPLPGEQAGWLGLGHGKCSGSVSYYSSYCFLILC